MRPGRLDKLLYVGPPDEPSRAQILKLTLARMAVAPDVDIEELARLVRPSPQRFRSSESSMVLLKREMGVKTEGCTGVEVVSVCQEAGLCAMKEDLDTAFVGFLPALYVLFLLV
jgi:AAA family ATPase